MNLYALNDDGSTRTVEDVTEWARLFEQPNRVIAQSQVGFIWVSTVFLGIDHGFGGGPLLFETMAFAPRWCLMPLLIGALDMTRTPTMKAAKVAHLVMCDEVRRPAMQLNAAVAVARALWERWEEKKKQIREW